MTNKKVAFLVERNLYYKFFSPIIESLLKNNIEVHLLHYCSSSLLSSNSSKLFYYPQLNQIPQFGKPIQHIHRVETPENLKKCIADNSFNCIFSLHPKAYYQLQTSAEWVTIQHGVDSIKYKDQTSDHYIIYSKNWFEDTSVLSKSKVFEAGLYYSEPHLMNRDSILKKYNLIENKRYVLFIPLPAADYQSYTFWPFKKLNALVLKYLVKRELKILKKLKESFDQTNTAILIKSRFKRFLSQEYQQYATIFYDDSFYPSTTNELVFVSDHVYINYMPGAILTEIAALNKPYTYIHYPILEKYTFAHIRGVMKSVFLPDESLPHWVHHKNSVALANYKARDSSISADYVENYISPKNKLSLDEILKRII